MCRKKFSKKKSSSEPYFIIESHCPPQFNHPVGTQVYSITPAIEMSFFIYKTNMESLTWNQKKKKKEYPQKNIPKKDFKKKGKKLNW